MRVCMPPDPNPRKPTICLPKHSCDTHFHVFGPPNEFPFAKTRQYEPPAAPIEHYHNVMAVIGIERAVVVQPSAHGFDNTATLNAVAVSGGRLRGVARVNDRVTTEELRRLHEGGVRGVRFNILNRESGNIELAVLDRVVDRIAALGWSVDLHIDPTNLLQQESRIRAFPIPYVIDHMARIVPDEGLEQPGFQLLLDLIRDDKCWVKVTGADKISSRGREAGAAVSYRDVVPYARAVIAAAPDRILWGTDWPHSNNFEPGVTPNDGELVDMLAEFAPDEDVRRKILVDNPALLYGFEAD